MGALMAELMDERPVFGPPRPLVRVDSDLARALLRDRLAADLDVMVDALDVGRWTTSQVIAVLACLMKGDD